MKINLKLRLRPKLVIGFFLFNIVFAVLAAPFILFWGPFTGLKVIAVGAVATSRHPQFVRAFLTQVQIDQLSHYNDNRGIAGSQIQRKVSSASVANESLDSDSAETGGEEPVEKKNGVVIEDIEGAGFKGKVMLVRDPQRVKVAVTNKLGTSGQKLPVIVKSVGAVAGINAGGFYDPDGKGTGGYPDGLTMHNGQIIHNVMRNKPVDIVGLDDSFKLIMGKYTAAELLDMHVQEAVSFGPELIVNGKPVIEGDGGWGIAPRTAIGQAADGTIILVAIDGRLPTWSWGATLRDLVNVFLRYNAINAYNLDGGSSTEIVYNNEVLNRPCSPFGERDLPTAFVVMPEQ